MEILKRNGSLLIFYGILLILSIVYCTITLQTSDNIPYLDDYIFISFINDFKNSTSLSDKLSLIFSPHNEHQIFTTKVFFLIQYYLLGELNFKYFTLIPIFSFLVLFSYVLHKLKNFKDYLFFVPLLLFIPIDNLSNWSMVALCWGQVLFYGILSLYLLSLKKNTYFIFSIIASILCSFSLAQGLLVYISGTILVFFLFLKKEKQLYHILIWILIGIVNWSVYFTLNNNLGNRDIGSNNLSHSISNLDSILIHFSILVVSPLKDMIPNTYVLFSLGFSFLLCIIIILRYTFKNSLRNNITLISILSFLIISMALISVNRFHIDILQSTRYRYSLLPLSVWVIIFTIMLNLLDKRFPSVRVGLLVFSSLFYLNKVSFHHQKMTQKSKMLKTGIIEYLAGNPSKLAYPKHRINSAVTRLKIGSKTGIYDCKKSIHNQNCDIVYIKNEDIENGSIFRNQVHLNLAKVFINSNIVKASGYMYSNHNLWKDSRKWFALRNNSGTYLFELYDNVFRPDVNTYLNNKFGYTITKKQKCGFDLACPIFESISSDNTYSLYLLVQHEAKLYLHSFNKVIQLDD